MIMNDLVPLKDLNQAEENRNNDEIKTNVSQGRSKKDVSQLRKLFKLM